MKKRIMSLVAALAAGGALLSGCKEEPPPPPPPPPPPAPPPPEPEPVEISGLLASLDADPRLQFPQNLAPVSEPLASAVIRFGDALAQGDDAALRPMLDVTAKAALERLLVTGGWYDATDAIEAVRVVDLTAVDDTGTVTYALQQPGEAYTMTWDVIEAPDGGLAFSAIWTPEDVRSRAVEFDDGASPSSPTSAFDPGGEMDDMGEQAAATAALGLQFAEAIADRTGETMPIDAMKQMMAAQAGVDVAEFDEMITDGNDALARGVRPDPMILRMLIDQTKMGLDAAEAAGENTSGITLDTVFEVLGDIMGISASEVQSIYDNAGG